MTKYFLTIIILFLSNFIFAQVPGFIGQRIDIKEYQGKTFELQVAIKSKAQENGSGAGILIAMKNAANKVVFQYFSEKLITLDDWKIYSYKGKIDKDATSFIFGGIVQGKGIFYFDDFKLLLKTEKNKTTELPLTDNDFESDSSIMKKNWLVPQIPLPKNFKIQLSETIAYSGKQSLMIDGSEGANDNSIGNNSDAGKFININGIKLYYETYGQGKPLLLLHGNQQSISAFAFQIPELSKHYKVIAVDTRGQGKSTEDGKSYSYDLFADDMNAFLNALNIDKVNILGWSDGGNTGLIMAIKYPDKVKSLVTMGACIFIDTTVVDKTVFEEVKERINQLSKDSSYASRNSKRLYQMLLTEPNHRFEELKTIKCPVLVMAGANDIIKEGHTKSIAANIKNSELIIGAKETHEWPVDDSKSFNEAVLKFFKENE